MALLIPTLALLIAALPTSATAAALAGGRASESGYATVRFDNGPATQVTVSARIIRTSASIGTGRAPPFARMKLRRTTVSAADGRSVAALVYDFE